MDDVVEVYEIAQKQKIDILYNALQQINNHLIVYC
jgi:hypothetical protein